LSSRQFSKGVLGFRSGSDLCRSRSRQNPIATILFISCSGEESNVEADWAAACAEVILRQCPFCERHSIIGHGRRRKQAHDARHDWIEVRRGICSSCGKTFTFLPSFSLPYTHYSLLARSEALRRYFLEHCSYESAAPTVKNPDRIAAPSTLHRWFRNLDNSQPPFAFLRPTLARIQDSLQRGEVIRHATLRLSWPTVSPFLQQLWPLRL